ncbi:hypothetical protein A3G53_00980 [Candidatus Nomurabacteria bacterium RIFCSPLOWO2_12_FULL_44_11]|uniref:General secretion pathway GspH domain-containing protein n=1 Tax=Candidatus Nomurabacteria bacterium RIFCSPLOWO2_12_FULL_44_11 TaxID=1801796 RepID=A0A1F6Y5V7_9BACT|nr:MAG: hypothetical protein A3E95_01955 [Candidatus Nomurabacteria bacterium RIFCSPHIGHO2_12_FULL_44_22b]OGJ01770.1 MAG: hypothetical protein A3G53_00980 [Candidatus Nomurabacteria bacterium RIFCSPLOWO2_12_FULL_44_11]
MNSFYKKGVSIIEILIVLAVIGILMAVVLPQFSKMRESQVLKSAVGDISSALGKARGQTLASVDSSEYGVHFESDRVIIFKGKVFSAGAPDNERIDIAAPAGITNINLGASGGVVDVYFNRLSGAPSAIGTVTVTIVSSFPIISKIITLSSTGVVSVN